MCICWSQREKASEEKKKSKTVRRVRASERRGEKKQRTDKIEAIEEFSVGKPSPILDYSIKRDNKKKSKTVGRVRAREETKKTENRQD